MAGRARARKERQMMERAGQVKKPWKYARCAACKKKFICNNYADFKPRIPKRQRFMGKILCPWCVADQHNMAKRLLQLEAIAEAVAKRACTKYDSDEEGTEAGCRCLSHSARKVLGTT